MVSISVGLSTDNISLTCELVKMYIPASLHTSLSWPVELESDSQCLRNPSGDCKCASVFENFRAHTLQLWLLFTTEASECSYQVSLPHDFGRTNTASSAAAFKWWIWLLGDLMQRLWLHWGNACSGHWCKKYLSMNLIFTSEPILQVCWVWQRQCMETQIGRPSNGRDCWYRVLSLIPVLPNIVLFHYG